MAKKPEQEILEQRREKILSHLKADSKPYLLEDLKNALKLDDEQTLRRDLDVLAKKGIVKKSKEHSNSRYRSVYQLNIPTQTKPENSAKKTAKNTTKPAAKTAAKPAKEQPKKTAAPASKVTKTAVAKEIKAATKKPANKKPAPAKPKPVKKSKKILPSKPVKQPASATAKPVEQTTGTPTKMEALQPVQARPVKVKSTPQAAPTGSKKVSARELEAQILSALAVDSLSPDQLAEKLQRQRPTIVKALDRLQDWKQISRSKQGRAYHYFLYTEKTPASPPASSGTSQAPAAIATSAEQLASPALADSSMALASPMLPGLVKVAVDTFLDRLISAERRAWELESSPV